MHQATLTAPSGGILTQHHSQLGQRYRYICISAKRAVGIYNHIYTKQCAMLDQAAVIHPNAQWWIKADGTVIVEGLWESTAGEWSQDVDFNDKQLVKQFIKQLVKQFIKYKEHITFIAGIGLEGRQSRPVKCVR